MGCCFFIRGTERNEYEPIYFEDKLLAWDDLEAPFVIKHRYPHRTSSKRRSNK